ncbi:MAG: helix-turn-helix transcriptional regulator [Isosphaeraceae bacterium]
MTKHERPRPEARGVVDDLRQDHLTMPSPPDKDLPEGVTTLAAAMHELVGILPGLRLALERTARPVEPPVAYRKQEAARLVGISPRLLERLLSAGRFCKPDAHAGRCPLWTRATLEEWVRQGGGRI